MNQHGNGHPMNSGSSSPKSDVPVHQIAYQPIHQQHQHQPQLQEQLPSFWASQYKEIQQVNDFKHHSLPLARIKKIIKEDENVVAISQEVPVIFARASEMFIQELTLRAWNHTKEKKRKTLRKNDIQTAISRDEMFDFLIDTVPREDVKNRLFASVGGDTEGIPYYYRPVAAPGMFMEEDQALHRQQLHPYMAPQMWPHQQPP